MYRRKRKREGITKHYLYNTYWDMVSRCYRPKDKNYVNYGERGIKVCERWLDSFWDFVNDMGERPEGHTLDRIDNNGDYEPNNCRWATAVEQARNTRKNVFYELNGEVLVESDLADRLRLSKTTIGRRRKKGWDLTRITSTPAKKAKIYLTIGEETHYIKEWSAITGVCAATIQYRKRRGWSDYECIYGRNKGDNNEQNIRANQQDSE